MGRDQMLRKKLFSLIAAVIAVSGWSANASDKLLIEGEIAQVSIMPEAKKSDYPNCNYTARLHTSQGDVILVLPGFRNHADYGRVVKEKELVQVDVCDFETAPAQIRETQLADDLMELDTPYLWVTQLSTVKKLSGLQFTIPPRDKQISRAPARQADLQAAEQRKKSMDRDRQDAEAVPSQFSSADDWKKRYSEIRTQSYNRYQAFPARWYGDSYRGAMPLPPLHDIKNFIECSIELSNRLKKVGVDLILVYIPSKSEISIDDMIPESAWADGVYANPQIKEIQRIFLDHDVEFIDPTQRLIRERGRFPFMYWYFLDAEFHPAEGASEVVAEMLAERLERYQRISKHKAEDGKYTSKPGHSSVRKFYNPAGNAKYPEGQEVAFSCVTDLNGKTVTLGEKAESPLLFIGNSFLAYPSLRDGASIPHYTGLKLNVMPDILYRDGTYGLGRFLMQKGAPFYQDRVAVIYPVAFYTFGDWIPTLPQEQKVEVGKCMMKIGKGGISWTDELLEPKSGFEILPDGNLLLKALPGMKDRGGKIQIKIPPETKRIAVTLNYTGRSAKTYSRVSFNNSTQICMRGETKVFLDGSAGGDQLLTVEFMSRVSLNYEKTPSLLESIEVFECGKE